MRLIARWEIAERVKLTNLVGDQLTEVEYLAHAASDFLLDINLEGVPGNAPLDPIVAHVLWCQCSRGAKLIPGMLQLVDQDVLTDLKLVIGPVAVVLLLGFGSLIIQRHVY